MFFNYLRIFVWGFGGFIVLYTGWAVYKTFNTPDYKTELFEKYPVTITLELIESDKYKEESVDTARDFIFSAFKGVDNFEMINEKLVNDFGATEKSWFKDNDLYFEYEFNNKKNYDVFLDRIKQLENLTSNNQRDTISMYFFYNEDVKNYRNGIDYVENLVENSSTKKINFKINSVFLKIPKYKMWQKLRNALISKYDIGFNAKTKNIRGIYTDDLPSISKRWDFPSYVEVTTDIENGQNILDEFGKDFDVYSRSSNFYFHNMDSNTARYYYENYILNKK